MSLSEWWLRDGWPDVLFRGYAISFATSAACIMAALLLRWRRRGARVQRVTIWWTLPIAAWAFQALLWALATTQLDLVTGFSRVPFIEMYAGTSFLAGLCIVALTGTGAAISGARLTRLSGPALALVCLAWIGTALAWVAVVVREMSLDGGV